MVGDAVELAGELENAVHQYARRQSGQQQADAEGGGADQQQARQAVVNGLLQTVQGHVHAHHEGLAADSAQRQENRAEAAVAVGVLVELHLADAAAPTLIRENDRSPALYVLMPMRV